MRSVANTYSGQISGQGSLALTGGSTLYLTNTSNSYTGYTNILSGTVVVNGNLPVNGASELGNSSLPIVVRAATASRLAFPKASSCCKAVRRGITINRNLDVGGYGTGQVGGNDGFALLTIGNNTFNGQMNLSTTADTRIVHGLRHHHVFQQFGGQSQPDSCHQRLRSWPVPATCTSTAW